MYRLPVYAACVTHQPLREPTLLILTALAGRPQHGYSLMQDVDAISQGRVRLRAGTLYGALDRLLKEELVRVEEEAVVEGRLRRTYALTEAGSQVLAAEAERLRSTADEATRRLAVTFPRLHGATG
ncbi:PadR family transcriptional regulator [Streptomyces shenzhenensis]|uniref:PadR family transcriptional regulator n=1 Tax=Streptomyces shenzhenensis TaxID=943815 RepID=UPI0036BBF91C